jgi:hypothetical protein
MFYILYDFQLFKTPRSLSARTPSAQSAVLKIGIDYRYVPVGLPVNERAQRQKRDKKQFLLHNRFLLQKPRKRRYNKKAPPVAETITP